MLCGLQVVWAVVLKIALLAVLKFVLDIVWDGVLKVASIAMLKCVLEFMWDSVWNVAPNVVLGVVMYAVLGVMVDVAVTVFKTSKRGTKAASDGVVLLHL